MVYDRTGRNGHDGVEVGRERGGKQVGGKRSLGSVEGEQPQSRLRLGGDIIELSDYNEISIAPEDTGDEETTAKANAGDEQSPEKGYDEGTTGKWRGDGNDVMLSKLGISSTIRMQQGQAGHEVIPRPGGTYPVRMQCLPRVQALRMLNALCSKPNLYVVDVTIQVFGCAVLSIKCPYS
ncbi:hypothetical protein Cgig2_009214 [Carnegiea gigantea]|uniref:Uncharacterized protein n=1 Tax=Carnegiea gigantea TaxID=171969 RepID=A0A9Q1JPB8_9CARY|nr:hypothetical protein Cgig2_009214 [Carnegiea gigantea]